MPGTKKKEVQPKVVKDSAFYAKIGSMGGKATKRYGIKKYGSAEAYYSAIGSLGGDAMKRTHSREWYSSIGKMSAKKEKLPDA